jgi:hypothetical protein
MEDHSCYFEIFFLEFGVAELRIIIFRFLCNSSERFIAFHRLCVAVRSSGAGAWQVAKLRCARYLLLWKMAGFDNLYVRWNDGINSVHVAVVSSKRFLTVGRRTIVTFAELILSFYHF